MRRILTDNTNHKPSNGADPLGDGGAVCFTSVPG
jgi:hypothetical protein